MWNANSPMLILVLTSLHPRGGELPARSVPSGLQCDPRKNKSLSLQIFTAIGVGTSVERNHDEE
ncbi:hypothetical protein J6590_030407 [Homalodisca vitripennis]|nr:hypothetical protein J6590_030407 [Homalodisca vitripennis]